MMEVHTLGDTLIRVGEKEIRPTSPLLFAALLYLGVERGRRVPRAALQELLFPNASERSGAHSLRQLLYKLRQLGAPIEANTAGVEANADSVDVDVVALESERGSAIQRVLDSPAVLPGYEPSISESFASWVDDFRERAQSRVVARLTAMLGQSRDAADRAAIERAAEALLKIDAFNEDATMARAEVLALKGQKQAAVRLLESFATEVGQTSHALRLPADVLRRRIEDRLDAAERNRAPLIGRDKDLAALLAQFTRSLEGQPTVSVIWGDAGIGKTRVVEELSAHLLLKRATVETVLCQPQDAGRPLGALIDVVPKLLNARGALGVAPDSLEMLKRLCGDASPVVDLASVNDPDYGTARIRMAISDLLVSIASERSLVLLVEDAHFLDADSQRLLTRFLPTEQARLHVVLTFRGRPALMDEKRLSDRVFIRQLSPLDPHSAQALLAQTLGEDFAIEATTQDDCVALAAGNPLFLCTIAENLRLRGGVLPVRTELSELLKQRLRILPAPSLLLMRVLAVMGTYGAPGRLIEASGLADDVGILALQDVADRGLVSGRDGVVKCAHDLLADVIMGDTPDALRGVVLERVARALERDGMESRHLGMLHASADCWRSAGLKDRALTVLRRCAEFANEVGQSSLAARILDEAQQLASENELLPLIEATIQSAELARDPVMIIANIERYAGALAARDEPFSDSHRYQILRVQATQYLGESVRPHIEMLLAASMDASRALDVRILAVRTVLLEAMQELDEDLALKAYHIGCQLVTATERSIAAREVVLLYNIFFGNLDDAQAQGRELFTQPDSLTPAVMANVAKALQYSGATAEARALFVRTLSDAEKRGLNQFAARVCGHLASLDVCLANKVGSREWIVRGEGHLEQVGAGYTTTLVYYRVCTAILDGDVDGARRGLALLETHPEATKLQGRRSIEGLRLLLSHIDGTLSGADVDFATLESIDNAGRRFAEHMVFALGMYVANVVAGRHEIAAQRLRAYLTRHQRERYSMAPLLRLFPVTKSVRERLLSDIHDTCSGRPRETEN